MVRRWPGELSMADFLRGVLDARGRFLVDIESLTKVQGQPLFASEIERAIIDRVGANGHHPAHHGNGGPA